jgi:hypothetical protein
VEEIHQKKTSEKKERMFEQEILGIATLLFKSQRACGAVYGQHAQ